MELFDYNLAIKPDTTPRHINGITCDAKNCIYHEGDNYCTAIRITVGSIIAISSSETRCATFEPRGDITRTY